MTLLDESPAVTRPADRPQPARISADRSGVGLVRLAGVLVEHTIRATAERMAEPWLRDELDNYCRARRELADLPELTRAQEVGVDDLSAQHVQSADAVKDAYHALGLDEDVYVTLEDAKRLRAELDAAIGQFGTGYRGRHRQRPETVPSGSRSYWGGGDR